MQFLSKSEQGFSVIIDELILKFVWKGTGPRIAEMILKKKNKMRVITLPDTAAN